MTKQQAIDKAGGVSALADLLKITPSAISQWGDEVPDARVWQLRVLKPEWFAAANDSQKARA
jgi:hypothetical protein